MNPWESASLWQGNGVRREAFFFALGSDRLYGSLYAAAEPSIDLRMVVCTGWGHDMLQLNGLAHAIALGVARSGGAALLFHPPGHGDSMGSAAELTVPQHVEAALAAAEAGTARVGASGWDFAGLRIGAAVATLASTSSEGKLLPLVEPVVELSGHFAELQRKARRLSLGRAELADALFGHPLPRVAGSALPSPTPLEAMAGFSGRAAAIRFDESPADRVPGLETVVVPGKLGTPPGLKQQASLASAAVGWIRSSALAGVAG